MTELQNNSAPRNGSAGTDIDLMGMLTRLWHARSFLLICCAVGAVLGLIVGFSIPKRYAASVVLAPESEQKAGGLAWSLVGVAYQSNDDLVIASVLDGWGDPSYADAHVIFVNPLLTGLLLKAAPVLGGVSVWPV